MKKKILLFALMLAIALCTLVVAVGAVNGYSTFEVTLTDGTKTTAYTAGVDPWEGRVYLNSTLYKGPAEAPPVGSEDIDWSGVEKLDWAEVEVVDFSNVTLYVLDKNQGVYNVQAYGTNYGGTSLCTIKNGITPSQVFTSLKKIITGKIVTIRGADFTGAPALEELVISNGLKEIQYNAFDSCKALKKITILDGTQLTGFGNQSFKGCIALESIHVPSAVTSIGSDAFNGCTALKAVTFADRTQSLTIGNSAFYGCSGLVEIAIPDSVTSLGNSAFQNCSSLKTVTITENSSISNQWVSVFRGCTVLESIYIPPLVTTIRYDNFWDCAGLKEVIFSENLENISSGNNFANCTSLEKIQFPNSLTNIASGNFSGCSSLKEIRFGNSLTALSGGLLILKSIERVYIPATVTSIGDHLLGYSNPADSSSNITFIFTGTEEQAKALQDNLKKYTEENAPGHAPNSSKFYDAPLKSATEYDADATAPSGFVLVYGYNTCDAFYRGVHIEKLNEGETDNNPCVLTECKTCGAKNLDTSSDATHNFDAGVIAYVNGFASVGTFTVSCQNANCVCNVNPTVTSVPAIYTYLGFAVKEDQTSLTLGYTFDKDAYESYIANNAENVVAFGFVAYATYEDESCNPLSVNSGVISPANPAKTIFASMSVNFAAYDFVIRGFDETTQDLNIAMCAYTYDGNNIKYLCKNTEGVYGAYDVAYATTISKEA